jgi:hypothetical protein
MVVVGPDNYPDSIPGRRGGCRRLCGGGKMPTRYHGLSGAVNNTDSNSQRQHSKPLFLKLQVQLTGHEIVL